MKIRRDVLVSLFLVIATLAIYWQVRNSAFVNFDDNKYVIKNPHVYVGLTLSGITWAFTAKTAANWHPLTWLTHMMDCEIYGLNPGLHHVTNLVFHIANTLLLFFVLRRMTSDLWRSAFVAALFAVHPLHVESVAWVAERKDLLSTFFWMLTMWGYTLYVERARINLYLLALLFFTLGLMAKPMLVTLPFVLLLVDYWPLGRFQFEKSGIGSSPAKRLPALSLVLEKIPFLVLAGISCVVTYIVQQGAGAVGSLDILPFRVRIANAVVSYIKYIGKMIWPVHLAVFYPHPGILPGWQFAGAGLLLVSISLLAIRGMRVRPYFTVGWMWYIGTLIPVIGLVQIGLQGMADRYTYVPLIGLFIIIAWGVPELVAGWWHREVGLATMAGALFSVLMATTWVQIGYWKNSVTLFEHALDVTTNNYLAHDNLGAALYNEGKIDAAIQHFREAVKINPDYLEPHNNLGVALFRKGRIDEAIRQYYEALRIKPDLEETHNNLGVALFRKGKTDEAIAHFREALRIRPDYKSARDNLRIALAPPR